MARRAIVVPQRRKRVVPKAVPGLDPHALYYFYEKTDLGYRMVLYENDGQHFTLRDMVEGYTKSAIMQRARRIHSSYRILRIPKATSEPTLPKPTLTEQALRADTLEPPKLEYVMMFRTPKQDTLKQRLQEAYGDVKDLALKALGDCQGIVSTEEYERMGKSIEAVDAVMKAVIAST